MDPPRPPNPEPPSPPTAFSAFPTTLQPPENNNNNNNTHVAANLTQSPPPTINHPPYADMIYAAITALKERDGSSRRAIAKYIEQVYPSLPTTHSALLTHHLKRLKSSGHLEMVKKSYKIPGAPRSDGLPAPPPDSAPPVSAASPGQPRGRGRPPKPKPNPDQLQHQPVGNPNPAQQQHHLLHSLQPPIPIPQQPVSIPIPIPIPLSQHQQPLFSFPMPVLPQQPIPFPQLPPNFHSFPQPSLLPHQQQLQPSSQEPNVQPQQPNSQLMVVEEPKKRPGRPRKDPASLAVGKNNSPAPVVSGKRGRGRPPGSRMSKKRPGRPPKPKTVSSVSGPNGIVKRRPGRPSKAEPRTVFIPYATNVPIGAFEQSNVPGAVVPAQPARRPRGRPKKDKSAAASSGGATPGSGRPRGRPPLLPKVERPKVSRSGRPVGRPKKYTSLAITVVPNPDLAANVELKRKLEYFQSRVGQAVGVLKPYFNDESAVDAAAAIQELEGLATISAPLIIATEQPVPQS